MTTEPAGGGVLSRALGRVVSARAEIFKYAFVIVLALCVWEKMRADGAVAVTALQQKTIEDQQLQIGTLQGEKNTLSDQLADRNALIAQLEGSALADAERRGAQRARINAKKGELNNAVKDLRCACPGASGRILRGIEGIGTQSAPDCECPPGPADKPGGVQGTAGGRP